MPIFTPLQCDHNLKQIIKVAFDIELDIQGGWGYTQEDATIILSSSASLTQFEHMFASMRAYAEMNIALEKEERYGSINLSEINRTQITLNTNIYDRVTYKITAMKKDIYAGFTEEYKKNYGKKEFDISAHFKQREEAMLTREVFHWFEISSL